jgi:LEA14-like dessication related protein
MKGTRAVAILTSLSFGAIAGADITSLIKTPKASIERIDIHSMSFRDITLLFDVGITNPYPVKIKLAGVKSSFSIEKNKLFETVTAKPIRISAGKKEVNQILVNLKYADIERIVKNYLNKEYLDCDVAGEIILQLPQTGLQGVPQTWSFPYSLRKKIPALKPEIRISNFTVKRPSIDDVSKAVKKSGRNLQPESALDMFNRVLSGKKYSGSGIRPDELDLKLDVSFDVELVNRTKAKMLFQSMEYDYFVNAERLVTGSTSDIRAVGGRYLIKIQNQFSSRSLGGSVLKAFNDRKGEFLLKGHTVLKLPESIKKEPLKLVLDEKGDFSF